MPASVSPTSSHVYITPLFADPLRLRKQALRVLMRQGDRHGNAMPRAVALELFPIICTSAHPDRTSLLMRCHEGAQRIGGDRK
jgi:hypothetical protein